MTFAAKANRAMMCQQCAPYSYANEDFTSCVCAGGYFAEKVDESGSELLRVKSIVGNCAVAQHWEHHVGLQLLVMYMSK